MLSRIWTEGASRMTVVASVLLLLAACGGTRSNNNSIKPIMADVTFARPIPSGAPVVYLDKGIATADVVTLNLMLHSSAPIPMDAFAFDVFFDPGLVNIAGLQGGSLPPPVPFSDTFLGTCNAAVACPLAAAPVQNPICVFNPADANISGDLTIGVAVNAPSSTGCLGNTSTPGMDNRLITLVFVASSTSSSPVQLPPISTSAGRCAILNNGAGIAISCDDRGAMLTGSR